jgi:preprotein translocase subunit SecA
MTGTAKTEEKEFVEIYGLEVVEIPTNVDVQRDDKNDLIFKTAEAKFNAVVTDVKERNAKGQPVLVGTIAVETSEYLSELLKRQGVPHTVLNAKEHAREAEIIKDAGLPGAVTIATNMAGRGVDIKIDDHVRELGGLYVLGTERHEARRIDNQLRGRSGRQGDPGETRFYLSGQDELVRLFAGDRIHNIMERFKLPDDQPMEAGILSRQIENAQKKVEEQNFVARKNVLKYDDVMNTQRQVIYQQRRQVLEGADLSEEIREEWLPGVISDVVASYTMDEVQEEWDLDGLVSGMDALYGTGVLVDEIRGLDREAVVQEFLDDALDAYREREAELDKIQEGLMRDLERYIVLQTVDVRWREHLENMDYMREGIHLRGMAQKDPLVEYRNEGHVMFFDLNRGIREEVVALLFHAEVEANETAEQLAPASANGSGNGTLSYEHSSLAGADAMAAAGAGSATAGALGASGGSSTPRPVVKSELESIGRNDPCWCGSGKKYKKCHGA